MHYNEFQAVKIAQALMQEEGGNNIALLKGQFTLLLHSLKSFELFFPNGLISS